MRGLLPIWKEKGMTSHDVVFRLRKILKMKKIGHTGTLDPDVEGVLLICLGEATKLVELLMDGQKSYQGQITLGYSTETEDASGALVESTPVISPVTTEQIDLAMSSMVGLIEQIPPYYSAVKVNGRRLYEYARNGETVERPVRQALIERFERVSKPSYDTVGHTQTWDFEVDCGKGTYVRTLAVDLGTILGYASHMSALKRTATGGFDESQALTLAEVAKAMENDRLKDILCSIEEALSKYPIIELADAQLSDVKYGKVLPRNYFGETLQEATVLMYQQKAKAIYYPHPTKEEYIKPLRMFVME